MIDIIDATIAVTGSTGMVGRNLTNRLIKMGCKNLILPSHNDYNFTDDSMTNVFFIQNKDIDVLINCAALCGGIQANREKPAMFFRENMLMGMNLIHNSLKYGVKKFVQIGTVCSYPSIPPRMPFKEDDLFCGYPELSNAPYGVAKAALGVMLQAYYTQYKFNSAYLVPTNMYGPYDSFGDDKSHVIPATIKKILKAKSENKSHIDVWGSGVASRDFCYIEDFVDALILSINAIDNPIPINIGPGIEVDIKELCKVLFKVMDYSGEVIFDKTKPDGQPRRRVDNTRAKEILGWQPSTDLETGLRKTLDWYMETLNVI